MKPVQYETTLNRYLADDGWLKITDHKLLQSIYLSGYRPDHNVNWRGHEWTRQTSYERSKEELGMALNPQEMY